MRADARRNYELLVTAARDVFAREGGGASMEAIARRAGVGVGTLYRHFPKRIDVVEAVYRTDVDNLVHTAEQVSADLEPWPAVVAFLEAFVRYAQGKRTFLNELHEAFEKNPGLRPDMLDRVQQAMQLVIGRGQRAGVVRGDVNGSDLMQLVGPMCSNSMLSEEQSMRLLTMILDGLHKVP
jgi:AcrR family transcriptional regulator